MPRRDKRRAFRYCGFRIADFGFGAAFSNGPSAGPVYDMEAISNCGTAIGNFRFLRFREPLAILLQAAEIAAAFKRKCVILFGHTSATSLHRETTYSKSVISEKIY